MDNDSLKKAVLENVRQRRSTRSYLQQAVPADVLEEVVEAGRYAPSANNLQLTGFYVISNAEKLAELKTVVTGVLANMPEREGMPPVFINLINRAKEGLVDVTYGAPVLIVTTNKKGSPNAIADCSCALQNMMLAATANGLGNCWINQFFMLRDAPPIQEFFAGIGVSGDEEICGSLALGYAENLETAPLPRTGCQVTYVK